jgi:hypothetical protein
MLPSLPAGLPCSSKTFGEIKPQLYRALHRNDRSNEIFEHLYKKADEPENKTSTFFSFLNSPGYNRH